MSEFSSPPLTSVELFIRTALAGRYLRETNRGALRSGGARKRLQAKGGQALKPDVNEALRYLGAQNAPENLLRQTAELAESLA